MPGKRRGGGRRKSGSNDSKPAEAHDAKPTTTTTLRTPSAFDSNLPCNHRTSSLEEPNSGSAASSLIIARPRNSAVRNGGIKPNKSEARKIAEAKMATDYRSQKYLHFAV